MRASSMEPRTFHDLATARSRCMPFLRRRRSCFCNCRCWHCQCPATREDRLAASCDCGCVVVLLRQGLTRTCSEWFVGTRGEHRHHTLHTTGLFIRLEAVVTVAVVCWTSQQRACLVGAWSWQPRDGNKRNRGTTVPPRGRTWVTMQVCRTKHGQRNLHFASVRSAVLSLWQARVAMSRVFRRGSLFSEPRFWRGFSR